MCLDSLTLEGLSDQVSETLSTQNEGKDGYSALDSINVGLPSGSFVAEWSCPTMGWSQAGQWVLLQGDEAPFLSAGLESGAW